MHVGKVWLPSGEVDVDDGPGAIDSADLRTMAATAAACSNAELTGQHSGPASGDPTELALLELARTLSDHSS